MSRGRDFRLKPIVNSGLKIARSLLSFGQSPVLSERAGPLPRGENMKPSTTDEIKGKLHEMKGKVKEKAGQVTNNPKLAAEGQDERLAGKVQKKVGQIEKVFEK
jgi:uncharacterized protein YjbJ (UPF0337 family)